jgi:hypothetical protein
MAKQTTTPRGISSTRHKHRTGYLPFNWSIICRVSAVVAQASCRLFSSHRFDRRPSPTIRSSSAIRAAYMSPWL